MVSRREFIQAGLAASALPLVAGAAPAFPVGAFEPAPVPLYKVIYDERFAASRAFGREAGRLGLPVRGIAGDITALWYDDLWARWRAGPAAIAGLTAHGPLFCLETLAREAGMRVIFRAEHAVLPAGGMVHDLTGPESLVREVSAADAPGAGWGRWVARLVATCPAERDPASRAVVEGAGHVGEADEALHSWVIAPVRRA